MAVFACVSDLSRHGAWNSGLKIEAVTFGLVDVGRQVVLSTQYLVDEI
jgi:hypothetical protein